MGKSNEFYIAYSCSKAGSYGFGTMYYTQTDLYPLTGEAIRELLENIRVANDYEAISLISSGRFEGSI